MEHTQSLLTKGKEEFCNYKGNLANVASQMRNSGIDRNFYSLKQSICSRTLVCLHNTVNLTIKHQWAEICHARSASTHNSGFSRPWEVQTSHISGESKEFRQWNSHQKRKIFRNITLMTTTTLNHLQAPKYMNRDTAGIGMETSKFKE